MYSNGETVESSDGTYRVGFGAFEPRMSHWVFSPVITHVPSGEVLLDLNGTLWDAAAEFRSPTLLYMEMRKYPGDGPGMNAEIDLANRTVTAKGDEEGAVARTMSLTDFARMCGCRV